MPQKFRKGIDLQGQRAIGGADPTTGTDLATKQYVDQLFQGVNDLKEPVRGTTTGAVTIASLINGLVHDGVTYATGDSILVKNNTDGTNGIYVIGASGSGTRRTDADASAEVTRGMAVTVLEGTTKGTGTTQANPITYVLTNSGTITLGTTVLTFSPIGGTGATAKAAGNGLTEDAGNYHVGQGTGISVTADAVGIDTSVVGRVFQADCVATTNPQTFTHGLGKKPHVQVELNSTGEVVIADVTVTTTQITVDWGSAPAAGEYRVNAVG